MLDRSYLLTRFEQAASFLPQRLRQVASRLDEAIKISAEELRLRTGRGFSVLVNNKEIDVISNYAVNPDDIFAVLEIATGGSVHTSADSIKNGFITVAGGHRIGICGTCIIKSGEISFIKNPSSVSIRIAREVIGAADEIMPCVVNNGLFLNTLIISPPGCGKTTLLRDMVRQLATVKQYGLTQAFRISVADERGEIAAQVNGQPQFDVGKYTDILDGCAKSQAMLLMLRAMSPQIIAVDEITASEDILAMEQVCNCGVGLLATAHGYGIDSLIERPLYRRLLSCKIFSQAIILSKKGNERVIEIIKMPELAL